MRVLFLASLISVTLVTVASASTVVIRTTASAAINKGGPAISSPVSTSPVSTQTQTISNDFDQATITATQSEDRTSSISLSGFAANGTDGFYRYSAETILDLEITNTDSFQPQDIFYDFAVTNVMAELRNGYGPNTGPYAPQEGSLSVAFTHLVLVGAGSPVVANRANYQFWTYSENSSGALAGIANIIGFSGTPTPIFNGGQTPSGQTLEIADLNESVYLGRLLPGETKDVSVQMSIAGAFSSAEHEFHITMNDPGGTVRFESAANPVAPVPLPASLGLMLAGLGLLGALHLRKSV